VGKKSGVEIKVSQLNYYDILEVSETASLEVIKAAYRTLSKRYHPDARKEKPLPKDIDMALINEAYEVLSDEQKRKRYDEILKSKKASSRQYQKTSNAEDYNSKSKADFTNQNYTCKSDFSENQSEDADVETETIGWFGKMVKGVGKEIVKTMQNNSREIDNAYLAGLSMDDYLLVKCFKQSSGYKRAGYAKALEEKGLLERNYEGKLIPTYRFKQLF